jgi:3-oxoacyl-[acyl-carrier protein] reductase
MNKIDLEGRVAVITGGASGLGFAIAERMAQSGAHCVIWDYDADALLALPKILEGATTYKVDVSDLSAVEDAARKTLEKHRSVDILINNAGITGATAKVWDYPIDEWMRVFAVNVNGTFYCSRTIVPHMRKNGYGRVVNIASVAGKDGNPNASGYSASKAAIIALTKSLGKELADADIRVNCVTPAAVRTPLFAQLPQQHIDFMLSKIPLGRFGLPEEVASLVAWLSSAECSFSTGAVFDISGGRSTY